MVLPTFARQALSNKPITVFGSGEQSRCFAHVFDVLDALLRCVASDRTAGEIFNVGSTEEVTINQLAERVIARSRSKSVIRHLPYTEAYGEGFEDMERRVPDIRKAREWFGYSPTRTLTDIIDSVVEYCQQEAEEAVTTAVSA